MRRGVGTLRVGGRTRVEPDAAGAVHRVGHDHQGPGEPLRHVRTGRHRDAGAGDDGDAPGPAHGIQQSGQVGFGDVGDPGGVLDGEGRDRRRERVAVRPCGARACRGRRRRAGSRAPASRAPRSRSRARREVVGREPGGLRAAGIDDPHVCVRPQRTDRGDRIGRRARCGRATRPGCSPRRRPSSRGRRRMGTEPAKATDLIGHDDLRGAVDGEGTEPRPCAERRVQRLGCPVAGRVHPDATAEEDTDRFRPVAVDDGTEPGRQVVEALVPRRRMELVADPHQGTFESLGVVVHPRQRSPFRAGVPVRERVVLIAAHAHDLVTRDVDEDAAHRGADPAEAPDGSYFGFGHRHGPAAHRRRAHAAECLVDPPYEAKYSIFLRASCPRGQGRGQATRASTTAPRTGPGHGGERHVGPFDMFGTRRTSCRPTPSTWLKEGVNEMELSCELPPTPDFADLYVLAEDLGYTPGVDLRFGAAVGGSLRSSRTRGGTNEARRPHRRRPGSCATFRDDDGLGHRHHRTAVRRSLRRVLRDGLHRAPRDGSAADDARCAVRLRQPRCAGSSPARPRSSTARRLG